MAAARGDEPLPEDAEARIAAFTELVATAVSNAQAREDMQRLAGRAGGTAPCRDARRRWGRPGRGVRGGRGRGRRAVRRRCLRDRPVRGRRDGDGARRRRRTAQPGKRVFSTRATSSTRFARRAALLGSTPTIHWHAGMPSLVRALGIRSSVASPIVVEGRCWGAITAASVNGPLRSSAERRLTEFTDLVATAVANAQAHLAIRTSAAEQSALRRVATLVAASAAPSDVFAAVTTRDRAGARRRHHPTMPRRPGRCGCRRRNLDERRALARRSGRGYRGAGRTSSRSCSRPAIRPASRAITTPPAMPPMSRAHVVCAPLSPHRSSSRAGCGGSSSRGRRTSSRSRRTPKSVSPASPSSWRPRSRTRRLRETCRASPSNRRRCAAWPRWSRGG